MADKSAIEWTDATWNPVTGCTKITKGCDNCYAERFAERFRGVQGHPYEQGFDVKTHEKRLDQPLRWRRPRRIFVNSMSDLFHQEIEDEFIKRIFTVMEEANWHRFQILTKRSPRMRDFFRARYPQEDPPDHIWAGVSVEDSNNTARIRHLNDTPAAHRFISAEPLLAPLGPIDLQKIDLLIAGGESGPGFRPMEEQWLLDLRDQCLEQDTEFFFKQWGGLRPKDKNRLLQGEEYNAPMAMTI